MAKFNMFRPRIIPVLLLKDKGLVKTIQFKNPTYVGDPINAVKIFNDLKADELVFLDITATNENARELMPPNHVAGIGRDDETKKEEHSSGNVMIDFIAPISPILRRRSGTINPMRAATRTFGGR